MKNIKSSLKKKMIARYLVKDVITEPKKIEPKRTDINILLNRVKTNQKNESIKKIYFSAAASVGLLLFGVIIF